MNDAKSKFVDKLKIFEEAEMREEERTIIGREEIVEFRLESF